MKLSDHKSPATILDNIYMTQGYLQVLQTDIEGEPLSAIDIYFEHDGVIGYIYFIHWESSYDAQ